MWTDVFIPIVRNLTNDISPTAKLSDDQLTEVILVAATIVSSEYPFTSTYIFDYSSIQITPDPTLAATYDANAIALWSLRASCIINMNTFQSGIAGGVQVREGDSEIDNSKGLKSYSDLLKLGPCASYNTLLDRLIKQNSMGKGKCVGLFGNGQISWGNTSFQGNWMGRQFFDFFLRY